MSVVAVLDLDISGDGEDDDSDEEDSGGDSTVRPDGPKKVDKVTSFSLFSDEELEKDSGVVGMDADAAKRLLHWENDGGCEAEGGLSLMPGPTLQLLLLLLLLLPVLLLPLK